MNEDCLNVQTIVSATYDGEHVDAPAIAEARAHCNDCSECAAFVTTLAAVRRIPAQSAPRPAVEAAIAAMRAEVERATEERAATAAAAAAATQEAELEAIERGDVAAEVPPTVTDNLPDQRTAAPAGGIVLHLPAFNRQNWRIWASWAGGAAAVLVVASIATMQGARYIARDAQSSGGVAMTTGTESAEQAAPSLGDQNDGAAAPAAPEDTEADRAQTLTAGATYITLGDWVYRYTGDIDVEPAVAEKVGTTTSALDTQSAPQAYDVYYYGTQDSVAVQMEERWLGFELVTRSFQGRRYGLQSPALSGFNQWPALPTSVTVPTSDDGSPDLERYLPDDNGVTIYRRRDADPAAGFAIAPGTNPGDPAAGNPNWTWWAPVP